MDILGSFLRWKEQALWLASSRALLDRFVQQMTNTLVAAAFRKWLELVPQRAVEDQSLAVVGDGLLADADYVREVWIMDAAWTVWKAAAARTLHLEILAERVVLRIKHIAAASALEQWLAFAQQSRADREHSAGEDASVSSADAADAAQAHADATWTPGSNVHHSWSWSQQLSHLQSGRAERHWMESPDTRDGDTMPPSEMTPPHSRRPSGDSSAMSQQTHELGSVESDAAAMVMLTMPPELEQAAPPASASASRPDGREDQTAPTTDPHRTRTVEELLRDQAAAANSLWSLTSSPADQSRRSRGSQRRHVTSSKFKTAGVELLFSPGEEEHKRPEPREAALRQLLVAQAAVSRGLQFGQHYGLKRPGGLGLGHK